VLLEDYLKRKHNVTMIIENSTTNILAMIIGQSLRWTPYATQDDDWRARSKNIGKEIAWTALVSQIW